MKNPGLVETVTNELRVTMTGNSMSVANKWSCQQSSDTRDGSVVTRSSGSSEGSAMSPSSMNAPSVTNNYQLSTVDDQTTPTSCFQSN